MGLAQITIAAAQVDAQRLGYMAISLNAYDTTAEPSITAGSKVEVCGALYQAGADEAITGWAAIASSTDAYIKLVPAGAAVTAEFTDDVPTWDDAKQGWYDGLDRYVAKLYKDAGDLYTLKRLLDTEQIASIAKLVSKVIEIGNWDMDGTAFVAVAHGLVQSTVRTVSVLIRKDDDSFYVPLDQGPSTSPAVNFIIGPANVTLYRQDAGIFDSANYDTAVFNRGWITIWYEG